MNIKGLKELDEKGFPIMRNTFIFQNLSEIPQGHMRLFGNAPRWIMRGFDDNVSIYDHPYKIREARILGFKGRDLREVFAQLNKEMDEKGLDSEDRTYFVGEVFTPETTKFTGMGFRDENMLCIDIKNGVRDSRTDWDPDVAISVPIRGGRMLWGEVPPRDPEYRDYVARVSLDLASLGDNTHVDFACMKDGYFFYHDLCKVKDRR